MRRYVDCRFCRTRKRYGDVSRHSLGECPSANKNITGHFYLAVAVIGVTLCRHTSRDLAEPEAFSNDAGKRSA